MVKTIPALLCFFGNSDRDHWYVPDINLSSSDPNDIKYFFDEVAEYEANNKTRNYFMKAKDFYDHTNEVNKNSFEFSRIHRYYVFQKI